MLIIFLKHLFLFSCQFGIEIILRSNYFNTHKGSHPQFSVFPDFATTWGKMFQLMFSSASLLCIDAEFFQSLHWFLPTFSINLGRHLASFYMFASCKAKLRTFGLMLSLFMLFITCFYSVYPGKINLGTFFSKKPKKKIGKI